MTAENPGKEARDDEADAVQGPPGSEPVSGDGSIPTGGDGVGIGADAAPNTFEPEEEPDATTDNDS